MINSKPFIERICNSYTLLSEWARIFGKENIIVRPYEQQQFINYNLFDDFLSILDLNLTDNYKIPPSANESLHQDFLEIIRIANLLPVEKPKEQKKALSHNFLSDKLTALAPLTSKGAKGEKNVFLSPAKRLEILKKYEKNNQSIAHEFLGREDGKLFYDPLPSNSGPYTQPQLTLEKVTPILIEMIYSLNKRIKLLEKQQSLDNTQLLELKQSRRTKLKKSIKRLIPTALHPLAKDAWKRFKAATQKTT
ncbi:MAG: hypothetical protein ACYSUK_10425 [Planctomycetota bacterium]